MLVDEKYNYLIDLFLDLLSIQRRILLIQSDEIERVDPLAPNLQLCLILLANRQFDNMSDLSKAMMISNQQLTRVIDDLEKKEFIVRVRDEVNHRKIKPVLTEKALKRHEKMQINMRKRLEIAFNRIDEINLDDLIHSLETILKITKNYQD